MLGGRSNESRLTKTRPRTNYSAIGVASIFIAGIGLLDFSHTQVLAQSEQSTQSDAGQQERPRWLSRFRRKRANTGHAVQNNRVSEMARRMLADARRLADKGDLSGAIQIARRADVMLRVSTATTPFIVQTGEQSPAEFLRILEAKHRQHQAKAIKNPDTELNSAKAVPTKNPIRVIPAAIPSPPSGARLAPIVISQAVQPDSDLSPTLTAPTTSRVPLTPSAEPSRRKVLVDSQTDLVPLDEFPPKAAAVPDVPWIPIETGSAQLVPINPVELKSEIQIDGTSKWPITLFPSHFESELQKDEQTLAKPPVEPPVQPLQPREPPVHPAAKPPEQDVVDQVHQARFQTDAGATKTVISSVAAPALLPVQEQIASSIGPRIVTQSQSLWVSIIVQLFSTIGGMCVVVVGLVAVRSLVQNRFGKRVGLILRVEHCDGRESQELNVLPFRKSNSKTRSESDRPLVVQDLASVPFPFRVVGSAAEEERESARARSHQVEQSILKHVLEKNLQLQQDIAGLSDSSQ